MNANSFHKGLQQSPVSQLVLQKEKGQICMLVDIDTQEWWRIKTEPTTKQMRFGETESELITPKNLC